MAQKREIVIRMLAGLVLFGASVSYGFGQTASAERGSKESELNREAILPLAPSATLLHLLETSRPKGESTEHASHALLQSYRTHSAGGKQDERFDDFVHDSFTTPALALNLFGATQAQWHKVWPEYGNGTEGFEKRYYTIAADHVTNNFLNTYFLPTLLHQNPHSPRLGPDFGVWRRFGYALSRVVVTRDDNGTQTINSSLLLGIVASSAVKNLYYPLPQRGFSPTVSRIQGSVIDSVQENLAAEFLPDVEQFCWKHAPTVIKRLTQRLPFARKWQPGVFFETAKDVQP